MGILDRRKATCHPCVLDEMGSAAVRQDEQVVVDGRIVTAQAAGAAFPFGLKLVEVPRGREAAEQVGMQSCTGAKDILPEPDAGGGGRSDAGGAKGRRRVLADRLLTCRAEGRRPAALLRCGDRTGHWAHCGGPVGGGKNRSSFPSAFPHRRMEARAVRGMEELVPGVFGIPEPGGTALRWSRGKIDGPGPRCVL